MTPIRIEEIREIPAVTGQNVIKAFYSRIQYLLEVDGRHIDFNLRARISRSHAKAEKIHVNALVASI